MKYEIDDVFRMIRSVLLQMEEQIIDEHREMDSAKSDHIPIKGFIIEPSSESKPIYKRRRKK